MKAGRCCTAFELNPAKSRPLDISPVSLAVAFLVPTNPFRAQSLHHPARSQLVVLASTRLLPVLPDLSDTTFATGFSWWQQILGSKAPDHGTHSLGKILLLIFPGPLCEIRLTWRTNILIEPFFVSRIKLGKQKTASEGT